MLKEGVLARRYANALFGLSHERGEEERFGKDLGRVVEVCKSCPELLMALGDVDVKKTAKKELIEDLVGYLDLSPTVKNFLYLLVDEGRISILDLIAGEYGEMLASWRSIVYVDVTTASDLARDQEEELRETFEKLTGKGIVIKKKKDPGIIGGMIVKIDDKIYDGSVKSSIRGIGRYIRETGV